DLFWRTQQVVEHERDSARDRLRRHAVEMIEGEASFVDPHTLEIRGAGPTSTICGDHVVIAVGSMPVRPATVDFDDRAVLDADGIAGLLRIPRALTVVGGSVPGIELASMAAALGLRVTLVDRRPRLLDFVDPDLVDALQYHLRGLGVAFRLGEEVTAVRR